MSRPEHGRELPYYKIKESFRDAIGRVHNRLMLTPGYLPDLLGDDIPQIRRGLTYKMEQCGALPGQQRLFDTDPCAGYSQVEMRLCSDPTDSAADIYRQLSYKSQPFKRYHIKPPAPPD